MTRLDVSNPWGPVRRTAHGYIALCALEYKFAMCPPSMIACACVTAALRTELDPTSMSSADISVNDILAQLQSFTHIETVSSFISLSWESSLQILLFSSRKSCEVVSNKWKSSYGPWLLHQHWSLLASWQIHQTLHWELCLARPTPALLPMPLLLLPSPKLSTRKPVPLPTSVVFTFEQNEWFPTWNEWNLCTISYIPTNYYLF